MKWQELRKRIGTFLIELGSWLQRGPWHHYAVAHSEEGEPHFYVDGCQAKEWPWGVDVPVPYTLGRWSLLPFDEAMTEMLDAAKFLFAEPGTSRRKTRSWGSRWDWMTNATA